MISESWAAMESQPNPIDITGIIDLHVHSAPDIRVRSHHDIELAEQAKRIGAKAFVIKSHLFPTVDRAWLLNKLYPEVEVYGSITLNASVGGINPHSVDAALQLGAKTVWLPTLDSTRHRSILVRSGGVDTVLDGKVVPPLKDVLKLIAEYNVILGTGHLSPEEIFVVVEEARKQGVEKIVVTHPESYVVQMSVPDQRRIVEDYQIILERCYAQPLGNGKYKLNHEENLKAIEQVGVASTVISTDGGQIELPCWSQMLTESVQYLFDKGICRKDIVAMTQGTPAKLLGLN